MTAKRGFHLIEVPPKAGRKIVEPNHPLIELKRALERIRPYETCNASDQPGPWVVPKLGAEFVVTCHLEALKTQVRLIGSKHIF